MRLILVVLLFFKGIVFIYASPDSRSAQVDDIREATFRYQFTHNASGQQGSAKVYFLGLIITNREVDPSDAFMMRFAGTSPAVKKISDAAGGGDVVHEKLTGAQGLIFIIDSIQWISDDEVEVTGGYHEALLSSSEDTYYLKRQKGKWVVTKDVMKWIS